tara:strand:+ start:59 stop:766 length:708 start_codon:yes stop_codon:yes gene_type:complete
MIFLHIPKTAGWTIARHLRDDEKIMDDGFGFAHEITIRDVPENYEDIVFSVVRCPFDRVWSLYNFYGQMRKDAVYGHKPIPDNYSFEDFVSSLKEWSRNEDHEYYMLEYKPCYHWFVPRVFEETEYGWVSNNLHLLRYENIQESYNTFRKTIGLEPFTLKKRNVNPRKKKEAPKYTDKMVNDINSVFSSDIKNFDYTYESFLQREVRNIFHEEDFQKTLSTEVRDYWIKTLKGVS